ncbi:MAG: hypothetical protein A3K90_06045 [Pelodictyon luteolum]|uniref:Uncharacterized protein n=1 Tax=Pelodictyon luteolum TaxID=1100 RepID=A0A165M3U9_PELLU|nr:hypothetical protein [Pelodictyon luteolum]KZK74779.1 MAG: hypothetical protein A3K90_06045 [Pelodictyon luteolum]
MKKGIVRKLTDSCTALDAAVTELLLKEQKIAAMSVRERTEFTELLGAITEDLQAILEQLLKLRASIPPSLTMEP